jgi:FtsP/CotA-like multicopper oxidase with cupredoxin domain
MSNFPFPRQRSSKFAVLLETLVLAGLLAGLVALVGIDRLPGSGAASQPGVKTFELVAQEVAVELQPGTTVTAWTYNGTMPGPEIRVTEGDLVRVTLKNELPTATTIHWHGVDVPNAMDGPAGLSQAPVEPGESFTYEFIATPGGTRWYHTHTDVSTQILLGLYGAFIVEPKEGLPGIDRDYTYLLTEWDAELTPAVALGQEPRGPRDQTLRGGEFGTDYFLMNGKMHDAIPPIVVSEGDRVRIRLINAGNVPHPFHTHGHSFRIVATDGNPVPEGAQLVKDTVLVAPGERYDLEFEATNPGVWMVHCHIENHADNGMMTVIQYEGEVPPGPLGASWEATGQKTVPMHSPAMTDDAGMQMSHGTVHEAPTVEATAEASPEPFEVIESDEGTTVIMTDNRFAPKDITVKAGKPLTFINEGANWHSVAGADGAISIDQLAAGDSFTVVIDTPGTYNLICKHHLRQGMTAKLIVTE